MPKNLYELLLRFQRLSFSLCDKVSCRQQRGHHFSGHIDPLMYGLSQIVLNSSKIVNMGIRQIIAGCFGNRKNDGKNVFALVAVCSKGVEKMTVTTTMSACGHYPPIFGCSSCIAFQHVEDASSWRCPRCRKKNSWNRMLCPGTGTRRLLKRVVNITEICGYDRRRPNAQQN